MNLKQLSLRLSCAGTDHVLVLAKASTKPSTVTLASTVSASEDTLVGLWSGTVIDFGNHSVHEPLQTKQGVRGTVPAIVFYDDNTSTYRAYEYWKEVDDEESGRTYFPSKHAAVQKKPVHVIELASNTRSQNNIS